MIFHSPCSPSLPKQNSRVGLNLGLMVDIRPYLWNRYFVREPTLGYFWSTCRGRVLLVRLITVWRCFSLVCATSGSKTSSLYVWKLIFAPCGRKIRFVVSSPTLLPKPSGEEGSGLYQCNDTIWDVLTSRRKYTVVPLWTTFIWERNLVFCPRSESGS